MATNSSEVSKAQENVLGGRQNPVSIYDEPVSGVQGAGTADRPYDQGNQAEQAAGPGIEPPSGQTGKGTPTQPYDQGNQPENTPSIVDNLSRTKPAANQAQNVSQIYGNITTSNHNTYIPNGTTTLPIQTQSQVPMRAPAPAYAPTTPAYVPGPAPAPAPAPAPRQEERKMSIVDQLSRTRTKDEREADRYKNKTEEVTRGRDQAQVDTTSSNTNNDRLAPPRQRVETERSVSPGQLDDGTHVRCSGERGEAYSPPGTMGKIKGKLHFGSRH